ncbi:tRNA-splicing endonuclease subunit Sen34 [Contarinia nasturtii]|uniref:tRNA-splicing endonuclease subunit Sen34 n=1 Tax=Contarinia nasturtii TaxID=265458 RepID=UPI0012D4792C|nr:tRNA-splicing endonuclease subunit Sen34 [Contarinia nasturtii]
MNENKIKLSLIGDTAYCFNADDYMTIRTEYHIVGRLIGSTVKWPRNISLSGLPAIYSPYETQLLIDKGVIQLCKKTFSDVPNEENEAQYVESCEGHLNAYKESYMEKRIGDAKKCMDKILAGKRKKVAKLGGDPNEITEEAILEDVRNRAINDVPKAFVQIPTQEPFIELDFEEVKTAPNIDPIKYHVFCDLWGKGHWITFGAIFGGDFLIYPGEPFHFHASHIIHVLTEEEAKSIPIPTFITRSRLSVAVKKLCTFVYENNETHELCYQTVQWQGK